jgi:hypothetical protein
MKTKIGILIIILLAALGNIQAQDVTTVTVKNSDISDNLDLEAVASLFGDAENLEDFEKKLNDPEAQISNLDLNNDGVVDYLRVIETSTGETHVVTIQAVIGKDQYQDVATIDVERDNEGNTQVRVVGDVYMYGPDYVIEPVYVHRPVMYVWFWGPYYRPWYSPYYYGYYPPYYRPWNPYPVYRYRRNVVVHKNVNNAYRHSAVRRSATAVKLQNQSRRSDYESKYPNKTFTKRNTGVRNKQELIQKRKIETSNNPQKSKIRESTKKNVKVIRKSDAENKENKSKIRDKRDTVPSEKTKPVQEKSKSREKSNTKTIKEKSKDTSEKKIKR